MSADLNTRLRELPSVDEVLRGLDDAPFPRELVAMETRRAIEAARVQIRAGGNVDPAAIPDTVRASLSDLVRPSLRRVINATGVVLHTNLGRAPLAATAPEGYSNLEYDLATGKRGKRDTHVAGLIERLAGAPGILVNNNAAAVWLVLNELASGGETIVSRGELIEIGDGFRIPDIMARSGTTLREVGTTNRTRIEDYRDAINERTRLIMRVHPSNFHISGFTARPTLAEIAALARERGIPFYEDLGSGCLVDLREWGVHEPTVADSLKAGVDIVSFSGDKLLGGPQAGLVAGNHALVQRCRRNPMFRALRCDKLVYGAMERALRDTLLERWQQIPALRMIEQSAELLRARAEAFAQRAEGTVIPGLSVIGGGSTPDQSLPTWLVVMEGPAAEMERNLRRGDPAVVARIEDDRLVLDLRTVFEEEEGQLLDALMRVRGTSPQSC